MKIFRTLAKDTIPKPGCVLTIGNYDGIHIGHQRILAQLVEKGHELGLPAVVMTFLPSPESYFRPCQVAPKLTSITGRYLALQKHGVEIMLAMPFNQEMAETSAQSFIRASLVEGLNVRYILIGDDFRFGSGRKGDYTMLNQAAQDFGFAVDQIDTVADHNGRVSSTRIRQALANGDLKMARVLLGNNYYMVARVAHGDKRGREWGFPTLNIPIRSTPPLSGVFAVTVQTNDAGKFHGVANLGKRPTVDGLKLLLEVHLFEFDSEIYGQRICVEFVDKIRDEQKFDSLDSLKKQIRKDCQSARKIFGLTT